MTGQMGVDAALFTAATNGDTATVRALLSAMHPKDHSRALSACEWIQDEARSMRWEQYLRDDPMVLFRNDTELIGEVERLLRETYADTDCPVPAATDVIEEVLGTVAADTLDRAEDQATCGKVDDCVAKAHVLRKLAAWLSPQTPSVNR